MRSRSEMFPYQRLAAEWMRHRTGGFNWLWLGGGKTVVAATAFLDAQAFGVRRMMVVGTKNIVRLSWPEELQKWEHLHHFRYENLAGVPGPQRLKVIESKPDIVGLNYDNLKWFYDTVPAHLWPDVLVLDEIARMKDYSTHRVKAHLDQMSRFKRIWGLTATPTMEGHIGLWAQEASVSLKRRLGPNITAFRARYCSTLDRETGRYTVSAMQAQEIEKVIAPITYCLKESEWLPKQTPTRHSVVVPWQTETRDAYDDMEKKLLVKIEKDEIVAANLGVALQKCRQLCAGFLYDEDGRAHVYDNVKLETLVDQIEGLNEDAAVVFYQFTFERDAILKALPGSVPIEKLKSMDAWNAGKIPVLVLHPESAGEGLNLQIPCCNVFWYSLPWSGRQYQQANGRVDRMGQTRPVHIRHLLRPDSIDEDILDRVLGKMTSQEEVIDRIKRRRT